MRKSIPESSLKIIVISQISFMDNQQLLCWGGKPLPYDGLIAGQKVEDSGSLFLEDLGKRAENNLDIQREAHLLDIFQIP